RQRLEHLPVLPVVIEEQNERGGRLVGQANRPLLREAYCRTYTRVNQRAARLELRGQDRIQLGAFGQIQWVGVGQRDTGIDLAELRVRAIDLNLLPRQIPDPERQLVGGLKNHTGMVSDSRRVSVELGVRDVRTGKKTDVAEGRAGRSARVRGQLDFGKVDVLAELHREEVDVEAESYLHILA